LASRRALRALSGNSRPARLLVRSAGLSKLMGSMSISADKQVFRADKPATISVTITNHGG
jgi:hypothetical protein